MGPANQLSSHLANQPSSYPANKQSSQRTENLEPVGSLQLAVRSQVV